jgi:hypothetical protein
MLRGPPSGGNTKLVWMSQNTPGNCTSGTER